MSERVIHRERFLGETMIYLDNAATTKLSDAAREVMEPYLNERYGNPSGIYSLGEQAKEAIEESRSIIAKMLHTNPENIFFTSGGTESDNWVLEQAAKTDAHIITTQIEHHAILNKCHELQSKGIEVSYIGVNKEGVVDLKELENNITSENTLISVMYANNEIGTIEPIAKIGQIAKKYGVRFHTDAVQAFGHIPIDVLKTNLDFFSASAHKFHGPKGVGFLYAKNPEQLQPFIHGGGQEREHRAGTENVAGIVGMGVAAKEAGEQMRTRIKKEIALRNYLANRILREVPNVSVNGPIINRLPGNINLAFKGINGTSLVVMMNDDDICISAGSACASSDEGPSHVLKALGQSDEHSYEAIRMTLNYQNTKEEIDYVINKIKENVILLR